MVMISVFPVLACTETLGLQAILYIYVLVLTLHKQAKRMYLFAVFEGI